MANSAPQPPVEAEAPKGPAFRKAHERDDRIAAEVKNYAKMFPAAGERLIARKLGISRKVLRNHYMPELELGRFELIASLASQEIMLAMDAAAAKPGPNGEEPKVKGCPYARRNVLNKMGGWGAPGAAFDSEDEGDRPAASGIVDLSKLTREEKVLYGRLAAKLAGVDPDSIPVPGAAANDGD